MNATATATAPVNANKALWEKGDFTHIARCMRDSGVALVQSLDVTRGMRVLDVGCGDGTTAIPAAERGAEVTGVDIARYLVEAGQARARALGLTNCTFVQGDASNLSGIPDRHFDLVVSIFGAMFAPRPHDVAASLVRVTRPGGRIVMGNWIPNDPTLVAQLLTICSAYLPAPPAGFVSPMMWGVESEVVERFTSAGVPATQITCTRNTWLFDYPGSPNGLVDAFRRYYAPTMNAYAAAAAAGREDELQRELEHLFNAANQSSTPQRTKIPATFLRVTVNV